MQWGTGGPSWLAVLVLAGWLPACGTEDGRSTPKPTDQDASAQGAPDADIDAPPAPDASTDAEGDAAQSESCPAERTAPPGEPCGEVWGCDAPWGPLEGGFGCSPPTASTPCPAGSIELERGRCLPGWTCPAGWHMGALVDGPPGFPIDEVCGPPVAAPFDPARPVGTAEACPAGALAGPEGGCVEPVAAACADVGAPPEGPGTLFVDARADATGADGTPERPFPSLGAAMEAALPGATIRLAAGRYPEPVTVGKDVTLWGRCPDEVFVGALVLGPGTHTTIEGLSVAPEAGDAGASVYLRGETSTLRRLRVHGEQGVALAHEAGTAALEAVRLSSNAVECARQFSGQASWRAVVLSPCAGIGAVLDAGTEADWRDVRIDGSTGFGILARGAVLRAERLTVAGSRPGAAGAGEGLHVREGARVDVTDVVVREVAASALRAVGVGSSVDARRLVLADARPEPLPQATHGWGVEASEGASVTLRAAVVDRVAGVGVVASGAATQVLLEDTLVRETVPQPDGRVAGKGVAIEGEATAMLRRVRLESHLEEALHVARGARVELDGLAALDTRGRLDDGHDGWGIGVQTGGQVFGRDVRVGRAHEFGLHASGPGTRVELDGLVVENTARAAGEDGTAVGVFVRAEAVLTLRGGLVRATDGRGIELGGTGTHAALTDVTVLGSGRLGNRQAPDAIGVAILGGASGDLERVRVADSRSANVVVGQAGSQLVARGLSLWNAPPTVAEAGGAGLMVRAGGQADVADALFFGHALFALSVDDSGSGLSVAGARIDGGSEEPSARARAGRGLEVGHGAQAQLTEVDLRRLGHPGVLSIEGAISLNRVGIVDVGADGQDGYGVMVQSGGTVKLTDVAVRGARGVGLGAVGQGSVVTTHRLAVERTRPGEGGLGGRGVALANGAHLDARLLALVDNTQAGLSISSAAATLADVVVAGTQADRLHPGDGLYVDAGGRLSMSRFRIEANRRAGVVVSASDAAMDTGRITGNAVGILRRLEGHLVVDAIGFDGNTEDDIRCETTCPEYAQPETLVPLPE